MKFRDSGPMFQECFLKYYFSLDKNIRQHFFMAATYCDPDGIHDMRVGIKRLRAFFRLIEWVAPKFRAKKRIRKIRRLFKAAAEIRDTHVQQELTGKWVKKYGLNLSAYYNDLKQKELPARDHFMAFAKKFSIQKTFEKNGKRIARALANVSDEKAVAKTRKRVEQLLEGMIEFGSENRLQEKHLHKVRILAKEARYTINVAQQCFPQLGYGDKLDKQLRDLHQVLGKWHDDEIALEHIDTFLTNNPSLRRAGGVFPSREGLGVGSLLQQGEGYSPYDTLTEHLQQEKAELLTTFEKRWKEFEVFLKTLHS